MCAITFGESAFDDDEAQCFEIVVAKVSHGLRLDQFLVCNASLPEGDFSRGMFQDLIARNLVLVDGQPKKSNYRVRESQRVQVCVPPPVPSELIPEPIDLTIIHEDSHLLVLSKPPGLVVHPACGNMTGTLVHGLLHHCSDLSGINGQVRPGIVHRLDKDTSGVMVVAKNDLAHHCLAEQFKNKTAKKIYHAILDGVPSTEQGQVCAPIGRHPVNRKKMAVVAERGRYALTQWKLLTSFGRSFSLVEISIETGRTHQIRVHMASIGLPVAGDLVYGKKKDRHAQLGIERQCLHASRLSFVHPATEERVSFSAAFPADMTAVLELLQQEAAAP
ncbi:MAG: RluA family pseudouridine synthase [Desulfobulbaceae bacterium]|nr:RluA family pseudouridine synthase [Desulfobulbaceae bacterium]